MTTEEKEHAIAIFLKALDEWGCDSYRECAEALVTFIEHGYDLSEWEIGENESK